MANIFKKLFEGDTVATYDGKVVKKLTTEEPMDSIVGTWVLNKGNLKQAELTSTYHSYKDEDGFGYFYGANSNTSLTKLELKYIVFEDIDFYQGNFCMGLCNTTNITGTPRVDNDYFTDRTSVQSVYYKSAVTTHYYNECTEDNVYVIEITKDIKDDIILGWLKANATKQ